jgi:hypothetical protein
MVEVISVNREKVRRKGKIISAEIEIIHRFNKHVIKVGNTGLRLTYVTNTIGIPAQIKLDFEPDGYWYINENDPGWEKKIPMVFCFALFHLIEWGREIIGLENLETSANNISAVESMDERTRILLKDFLVNERNKFSDERILLEQKTNEVFSKFVMCFFGKCGWGNYIFPLSQIGKDYFMAVDIVELIFLMPDDRGIKFIKGVAKRSREIIMHEPGKIHDFVNTLLDKVIEI